MTPELKLLLLAATPISELRGAIPVGLFVYHFSYWKTALICILGNILPIIPLIYFLKFGANYLSQKSTFFKKFFDWWFNRAKIAFEGKYAAWGKLALAIFVAIPSPMTGAWTGAVVSVLFNIKPKEAFLWITLGVLGACTIVSILCGLGFLIK